MCASCVRLAVREGLENPEMIRWLKRAAESGDAVAQANLGRCYELGEFRESHSLACKSTHLSAAALGSA